MTDYCTTSLRPVASYPGGSRDYAKGDRVELTARNSLMRISFGLAGGADASVPEVPGVGALDQRLGASARVAAWHWPMVADDARNAAYYEAIKRVVGEVGGAPHVLDIGSGSGVLAMMAARAGAGSVVAVDAGPQMAAVGRACVAANGLSAVVSTVNKHSTKLVSSLADIVVSEIVDHGLLGEGVLPAYDHAINKQLKPGGRVLPIGATVWAQPLSVRASCKTFAELEVDSAILDVLQRSHVDTFDMDVQGHTALAPPVKVCSIDFTAPELGEVVHKAELAFDADGTCNAVVLWFDLHLDEHTTISTGPGSGITAWRQALTFLAREHDVKAGTTATLTVTQAATRLSPEFTDEDVRKAGFSSKEKSNPPWVRRLVKEEMALLQRGFTREVREDKAFRADLSRIIRGEAAPHFGIDAQIAADALSAALWT